MIEVARHGAFSVNCVGLERQPFPLSFGVREVDGWWLVSAAAAQARELVDVLTRAANETVVVAGVETYSFLDADDQLWSPARIAAEQGVECAVHRVGVSTTGANGIGEEFLVMHRDDLPRFLEDWYPQNLVLAGVPEGTGPEQLDELAVALDTGDFDVPVLPYVDGARFWYSGHDDCYLAVETNDPALPPALLGRLLALLAGSTLVGDGEDVTIGIPEPGEALTRRLLGASPNWAGALGTASEGVLTVELWALTESWRLGQELPGRAGYAATLDLAAGEWRLAVTGA
ncbi:hypothetical protein [Kitasatospora sp. NPDC001683]